MWFTLGERWKLPQLRLNRKEVPAIRDRSNPSDGNALDNSETFSDRFGRCKRLLILLAGRVLGGQGRIEEAVYHCWRAASQNPPRLESEGAFRSWLLRILVDRALMIRRRDIESKRRPTGWLLVQENATKK